jgi:hypothetical protein
VAAGGISKRCKCRPASNAGIDWVFAGSPFALSDIATDRGTLVRSTSDLPIVLGHVTAVS